MDIHQNSWHYVSFIETHEVMEENSHHVMSFGEYPL
jgi:hypothetical protein